MTTLTVGDYLKDANLQVATDTFLMKADGTVRDDISTALMDGTTVAAMAANSQYHYGSDVKLFIEDQPGYRGSARDFARKTQACRLSTKHAARTPA